MKHLLACLLLAVAAPAFAAEAEWLTDVHAALDKAAAEHKYVMLDFTGSDWCGWCKKLKAEVFDQPEFIDYANQSLVLVEVDFPHAKQLSGAQQEANNALARKFDIRGYPTIIVIDTMSQKVGQAGYMAGGPKAFIAHLEQMPGMKHADSVAKDSTPEAPRHAPPAFVPIAPATPNFYADLALKGISGAPGSRMALINNQTLMVGETAKVRVRDTRVEIVCKEIRDDSVLVAIDGQTRELKLGDKSASQASNKTAQK
jgi:thioredoxin-related protein